MEDIFIRAKNILIIWGNNVDPERLPAFQQKIQSKAPKSNIGFENVEMLVDCKLNLKFIFLIYENQILFDFSLSTKTFI